MFIATIAAAIWVWSSDYCTEFSTGDSQLIWRTRLIFSNLEISHFKVFYLVRILELRTSDDRASRIEVLS